MRYPFIATLAILACFLAAAGMAAAVQSEPAAVAQDPTTRNTMLLVSLADGSVVMQRIRTEADICFKQNSDSLTTCLRQGAPVVDPVSNRVIGFEMIEETIELVAKSD